MPNPQPRPYAPLTARYGSIGQAGEWHEAIEAYYWDRLPEAFAIAEGLGAGFGGGALRWYRMIEAEALTRAESKVHDLDPHLSLEYVAHDVHVGPVHEDTVRHVTNGVARRLGWDFQMPVRVTILLAAVDAPWHGARFGYAIDKYPYDKICLPQVTVADPVRLAAVVAHEFTHVITMNFTGGRIPHWLDEGLAQLMEGVRPGHLADWMEPAALNAAFEGDRRDSQALHHAGDAYAQACTLVRFLYDNGGDGKLAELLHAFGNGSFWAEIKIGILGEPRVEEALRHVYGFGEHELFDRVRASR